MILAGWWWRCVVKHVTMAMVYLLLSAVKTVLCRHHRLKDEQMSDSFHEIVLFQELDQPSL